MRYWNWFLLLLLTFVVSCSKPAGTKAGVKLSVAGLTSSIDSGIGSGGTLLFGRSNLGDTFGKVLKSNEDNLVLPNGEWVFYALMWDSAASGLPLNDKVYCSKMTSKLGGQDVTLSFTLTNSNCGDQEFSGGRHYQVTGTSILRFADIYIEECDEVNANTLWYCGHGNQGSALSYRLKFQDFTKTGTNPVTSGPGVITSSCKSIDKDGVQGILSQGLPVNFPSGNGLAPFVVSIEMFLGSETCNTSDAKGLHTIVLQNGLASPAPNGGKVLTSSTNCSSPSVIDGLDVAQDRCDSLYGVFSASCLSLPAVITRFAQTCSVSTAVSNQAIKHIVSIPKPALCSKYMGAVNKIGEHPFAGGNGTRFRPYKICSEWQLNQIGEKEASLAYLSSSFKLMNDLDMNNTDVANPAAKTACSTVRSGVLKTHHNLNSLDKITDDCYNSYDTPGFSGSFFGAGHTISNGRIQAEPISNLGFVRKLSSGGKIFNLIFKNTEVNGLDTIGTVAGSIVGPGSRIANVLIEKSRIEATSIGYGFKVGGVVGSIVDTSSVVSQAHVIESKIRGRDSIGGVAGWSAGTIKNSHFRGTISTESTDGGSVGGIVGYGAVSSITNDSYSEGLLNSQVRNTGGIGGINAGHLNNVYSTMIIDSKASGTANIGGILGESSNANVSNVYFDGILKYSGPGTPFQNGILQGTTAALSNCYSSVSVPDGTSCVVKSSEILRTTLPTFTTTTPASWSFNNNGGSLPRLAWENRPCLEAGNLVSVAFQASQGRGTSNSPISICSASQLSELNNRRSLESYKILDDLNLSTWTAASSTVGVLNGQLDGNGRLLYGLNLTLAASSNPRLYEGIFREVTSTGAIKNLKLYALSLNDEYGSDDLGVGLLAGLNQGVISDIVLSSNKISGNSKIGSIVGVNKGSIQNIRLENSSVNGLNYVGGLVGSNESTGTLYKVSSDVNLGGLGNTNFSYWGGIAGANAGVIKQAHFKGIMDSTISTSVASGLHAGGIAGSNSGGIFDVLVDNRARLKFADSSFVGGLVGENSGKIDWSISLGQLIYDKAGLQATGNFGPLVGSSTASLGTYLFFLGKNTASRLAGVTLGTCTVDASTSAQTCLITPTPPAGANLFRYSNSYGGGQLSPLSPLLISSSGQDTRITVSSTDFISGSSSLDLLAEFLVPGGMELTAATSLNNYCPFFSSSDMAGTCTGGLDIAQMDGIGSDRIIAYYLAMMNNQPIPANAPVWELSPTEGPRLLQLDD